MSKPVVVEWPPKSGCFTKIMPGSQAMEYLEAARAGKFGSKSNPQPGAFYAPHMDTLHREFLKSMGMTQEQYLSAMERWNK